MIVKTLSGAPFLDEPFGGVYANRSVLVCGRSGTGKSPLGFQFVRQGIRQDERCLILSTMAANDLTILAESLGFSFSVPIDQGHLVLLEYQSFIPGPDALVGGPLPPEGFDQLREIIEGHSISRVVLDTVLPWIAVTQVESMVRHVFSFVRSCDRLGVTTLMTMPKPVSSMAFRLKKTVEDVVPISILLTPDEGSNVFRWQTVKYLGEKTPGGPVPYTVESGVGLTPVRVSPPGEVSAPESPAPPASRASPAPSEAEKPPPVTKAPVRFSSVLFSPSKELGQQSHTPGSLPHEKHPPEPARLAKVWKPNLDSSPSNK